MNTRYDSEDTYEIAMKAARGAYQRALLNGDARWSGADLQGKAKKYGGQYAASRENLLVRVEDQGLHVVQVYDRDQNGLKVTVIAQSPIGLVGALADVDYRTA